MKEPQHSLKEPQHIQKHIEERTTSLWLIKGTNHKLNEPQQRI
jgi:hypothetical protein